MTMTTGVRPRLLGGLVKREITLSLGLLLLMGAVAAAAAAYEVYGPAAGGAVPVVGRLLRRFDLTVLALLVLFLTLRIPSVVESDQVAGWLPAVFAAGGSRAAYGLGIAIASLIGPSIIFGGTAITFAVSVELLTGSNDLLRLLPVTAGAGLLLLCTYSVLATALGTLTRHAAAAWAAAGLLIAFPIILSIRYVLAEIAPPMWVMLVQLTGPPTFLPQDASNVLRATAYVVVVGAIALLAAHRYAGRTL